MPKRDFKFYTQSGYYLRFKKRAENKPKRKFFGSLFVFVIEVIVGTCFVVGNKCYQTFLKAVLFGQRQISNTIKNLRARLSLIKQGSFGKAIIIFFIVGVFSYGAILGLHWLAKSLELKNQLIGFGIQGTKALEDAKTDLQNKDFAAAQNKFDLAYKSFTSGPDDLQKENLLLSQLLNLLPQKQDSNKLFQAASLLSQAGQDVGQLYEELNKSYVAEGGLAVSGQSQIDLEKTSQLASQALIKVNKAGDLLNEVNPKSLPRSYQAKLNAIQANFAQLQNSFQSFSDLLYLTNGLLGGDKQILVLLENNNELRPTGGFIGTYADVQMHNGSIKVMNVSSIYDLDGQLRQKIRPPFPIFAVNDRWYLRDSNWFAGFPETARKAGDFYELEGGQTPDAVLALTPSMIQNLLKLTGPVQLPKYGVTLTPENFVEVTQVESSVNYSKFDNKPKQILADLVPVLLSKLGQLPKEQLPQLLQILQDSFTQKQIVLYFRDQDSQNKVASLNWGGEILNSDRDYLNINSANLNGSKTDLFLKQSVNLTTTIDDQGGVTNDLSITKTNTLPELDNTTNTSFIRVFVPEGSQLVSNSGFDYNTSTLPVLNNYKLDPDVSNWEKSIVKDLTTGISIGQESGKTFFGNWLTIKGGETKTVHLIYKLPFTLKSVDHYSLLLQKQIGADSSNFAYNLNFPSRKLLWQNFNATNLQKYNFTYNLEFNSDMLLGEVFAKKQ